MQQSTHLEPEMTQPTVLFRAVRIFDGTNEQFSASVNVLVVGKTIATIDTQPITPPQGASVIEGGGRVLMPRLIDAHWHTMMATLPVAALLSADLSYLNHVAAREAQRTLMRGFTTVRDAGGPCFGLKRTIDEGLVVGPRIYPSGAFIYILKKQKSRGFLFCFSKQIRA